MSFFSVPRTSILTHFGRRFVAYILPLFSLVWQFYSHIHLTQWLSNTVEGYCKGLTMLMESTTMMLGFKGAGNQTVPGTYPVNELPTLEINHSEYPEYDIESDGGILRTEPNFERHDSGHSHSIILPPSALSQDIGSPDSMVNESLMAPVKKGDRSKNKDLSLSYKEDSFDPKLPTISTKVVSQVTSSTNKPMISTPSKSEHNNKHPRVPKYARMRTLKLPGRQLRPMEAPSETRLVLRELNEEFAIERSKKDTYCSRELASGGIFVHRPTSQYQSGVTLHPLTARGVRRETSIGPLSPSWSSRHTRDIPTIEISKPEDTQVKRNINGSSIPTSNNAPEKKEGCQSNAVYVPSKTSIGIAYRAPADRVNHPNKNRTSMSDWLEAISAGNNSLVADHVATNAAPVLRTSLALSSLSTPPLSPASSTSSSDSSAPSTPVDGFFLGSPLTEEIKTTHSSGDRPRRARCSYLEDGYEIVVAPTIPEDLLTDEIGVAC